MTKLQRWMSRGMPGEASVRVIVSVIIVASVFAMVSLAHNSSAASTTLTRSVSTSSDDARYSEGGVFDSTEKAALVGSGDGSSANTVGYRFTNLTVPQGAIIDSVTFSVVKASTGWSRLVLNMGFEASDDAATFSQASTPAIRPMTSSVAHVDNNVRRSAGRRYTLGDSEKLAEALQQVVNRQGWQSGNAVVVLAVGPAQPAWARTDFYTMDSGTRNAPSLAITYHLSSQPSATSTSTSTPTSTSTSTSTATTTTTATATATETTPTGTPSVPIAYAQGAPWATKPPMTRPSGAPAAVAGQPCPAWVHDRYATQGPDGLWYPTWHPPVDPEFGCAFGHEHGADPKTSNADSSLPAFGYAAHLAGMTEPHVGYKIYVINAGVVSDEGRTSPNSFRIVFHHGTAGVGRYTQPMHSFEYDLVSGDGSSSFHVTGIADTGNGVGSTCTNPRDGGKDFSTTTCPDTYEIWNSVNFSILDPAVQYTDAMHVRLYVSFSSAVFDPITTQDPSDMTKLIYTQAVKGDNPTIDPASTQAEFRGCDREAYGGPNYWANSNGQDVYYTDPYGNVKPGPGAGLIEQRVSRSSTSNEQFKYRQSFCSATVHAPN
jgi:hypothetical protein